MSRKAANETRRELRRIRVPCVSRIISQTTVTTARQTQGETEPHAGRVTKPKKERRGVRADDDGLGENERRRGEMKRGEKMEMRSEETAKGRERETEREIPL